MGVWLRDLPAALAGWGFNVSEEPGWQTRGRGALLRGPRGVVNHWTATPFRAGNEFPTTRVLTEGRAGLQGPLCHLQLGFNGGIRIIAAGLAYHAGEGAWPGVSGNSDLIGIECEGDGAFTAAQLQVYPRLNAALAAYYSGVSIDRCFGHAEWAPRRKVDIHTWPGGMNAFRATVRTQTKGDDFLMALPQDQQNLVASSAGVTARALGTPLRSLVVEDGKQSEYTAFLPQFVLETNAQTYRTEKTVAALLEEQRTTNALLRQLIAQKGA